MNARPEVRCGYALDSDQKEPTHTFWTRELSPHASDWDSQSVSLVPTWTRTHGPPRSTSSPAAAVPRSPLPAPSRSAGSVLVQVRCSRREAGLDGQEPGRDSQGRRGGRGGETNTCFPTTGPGSSRGLLLFPLTSRYSGCCCCCCRRLILFFSSQPRTFLPRHCAIRRHDVTGKALGMTPGSAEGVLFFFVLFPKSSGQIWIHTSSVILI